MNPALFAFCVYSVLMDALQVIDVVCPYCGSVQSLTVDSSAGDQAYEEDCQVCCRAMMVKVRLSYTGEADIRLLREDD